MRFCVAHILFGTLLNTVFASESQQVSLSYSLLDENIIDGVILASPSQSEPNYYYQWVRDAALVMKIYINEFVNGNSTSEKQIKAYIDLASALQRTSNPSGNFTAGGLGEPKFYVNGTAFEEYWGRPQLDGPALRAISIMGYLNVLSDSDYVSNITQTVVKPDLDLVASSYMNPGFDLWEEVNGTHFFTAMVQARSMRAGAKLFQSLGDTKSATLYSQASSNLTSLIQTFWNSSGNTFMSTLDTSRSGVDCGNVLASIHGSTGSSDDPYPPSSDKILASTQALVSSMKSLYSINKEHSSAPAIGRYPEDIYNGTGTTEGNPWYLCTAAVAEVIYLAATELEAKGTIEVNSINLDFMKAAYSSSVIGTFSSSATQFNKIISGMKSYADGFMKTQTSYIKNGHIAEEIDRNTGSETGARDLSWSYAAYISSVQAKDGYLTYDFAGANDIVNKSSNILGESDSAAVNSTTDSNTTTTTTTSSDAASGSKRLVHFGVLQTSLVLLLALF